MDFGIQRFEHPEVFNKAFVEVGHVHEGKSCIFDEGLSLILDCEELSHWSSQLGF